MNDERVLVTGGSGFIGAHCVLRLLRDGYRVRTTVRSLQREAEVRTMLLTAGAPPDADLSFAEADLTADDGWASAVEGCDLVLHVASPFPTLMPRDANELIVPARDGALRVLRAARDSGVRRVVQTSSFAAVGYGHGRTDRPFTETDWTDLSAPRLSAYVRSKTLAERAAWEFVAREGGALELAVVNPVGVLGPVLGPRLSSSIRLVSTLLGGWLPATPRLFFNVVDVRDVADLHVRAMTDPAAAGERFIATAGEPVSMPEVARLLRARLGEDARRVPRRELPDWVLRAAALFSRSASGITGEVGQMRGASSEKARRVLGWDPRTNEEAILATAESLLRLGLVHVR
jgi:nucleoside-diphosphate-sugar epimerase